MILLELFYTFFIIGLFGFGGGYGMLTLIQTETVLHHHWLSSHQLCYLLWVYCHAERSLRDGDVGIRQCHFYLCTGVAFVYPDDSHQQDVPEVFPHEHCSEYLCRTKANSRRTACRCHTAPDEQRELQFP